MRGIPSQRACNAELWCFLYSLLIWTNRGTKSCRWFEMSWQSYITSLLYRYVFSVPIGKTCRRGYLNRPCFNAPLHNFPSLWGAVTHHCTRWQHQMHFHATSFANNIVIEIWLNFQICEQCAEKAISKITFNIRRNLKIESDFRNGSSKFQWCSWNTWVSRVTAKGSRTMGSEWLDKCNRTRFGSVSRAGKIFFRVVILPSLL